MRPLSKLEVAASAAVATAMGLCLYLRTVNPALAGGDSGELMVVAKELGTPHPPGYPTFALLSWAAVWGGARVLPAWVGPSLAMNAFHAVLSSLALGVIAASVVVAGGTAATALAAAGFFGFAPNVWTYAIASEVFPLNNFFSALIILCAVRFDCLLAHERALAFSALATAPPSNGALMKGGAGKGKAPPAEALSPSSDATSGDAAAKEADLGAAALQTRIDRFVTVAAFVYGLALTNQHTSVLYVVPLVLWVFARWPRSWRVPSLLARNSAAFFAGLSPYAYLPISNYYVRSPASWGRTYSLEGFVTHLLRKEYGTFSLASQEMQERDVGGVFARNTAAFVGDMGDQLGAGGAAVVLLCFASVLLASARDVWMGVRFGKSITTAEAKRIGGKVAGKKTDGSHVAKGSAPPSPSLPPALAMLVVTWALYVCFFNYLSNLPIETPLFYGVQQRFWLQPLIISVVVAGAVVGAVERRAVRLLALPAGQAYQRMYRCGMLALAAALVAGHAHMHFTQQDESGNFYLRDHGAALLAPLPPNSVLFTSGDMHINAARYVQAFEGLRPDVLVLDQELLTFKWYVANYKDYLATLGPNTPFANFTFPGDHYFPNKEGAFTLVGLIAANTRKGRRLFVVGGLKEGDVSTRALLVREHGIMAEIVTNGQGVPRRRRSMASFDEGGVVSEETLQTVSLAALGDIMDALAYLGRSPVPPPSRYRPHTWEYSIGRDAKQAYHNTGLMLLHAAARSPAHSGAPRTIVALEGFVAPVGECMPAALNASWALRTARNGAPARVALLIAANALFRTAVECYGDYDVFGYESARNAAASAQELAQHAADAGAFGRAVLRPHLKPLLNDYPSHETLSHAALRALEETLV